MIKIIGTGSYIPEKIVTNFDLEKTVDTTDQWITQRTGISERRIADQSESTSDLGAKAAQKALAMANMNPEDVELIILGTSTPDYRIPSTAPVIQSKLGCKKIPAFDINSVCTSFTFSLINAFSLLSYGLYDNCLVVGADTYSRILDWKDRNTCVIFGDGAGALLLKKVEGKNNLLASIFGADGSGSNLIQIPAGGAKFPIRDRRDFDNYKESDFYFQMDGKKVYEFTLSIIPEVTKKLIEQSGLNKNEVDWVVLHQANIRIIDAVSKYLDIPKEKFIVNIDKVGNTSSGSIPIATDEAVRSGKIKNGDKVLMMGFGGGLSWGGMIIEW